MKSNQETLEKFEHGLNPQSPEDSVVKAEVKGYGEISSIFSSVSGIPIKPNLSIVFGFDRD